MDMLQAAKTAQELRETLASLPQSPRDVYQALFRRIKDSSDQKDRLWAKRIVTWACFARETFDTAEIRYMTGLNPEDPNLYHDNLLPDTQITSLCAGLVVVESASRKVSLVHTEAQKHFQAHEMRYLPEAHIDIATGCVAHIHAFAKEKALDDLIELEFTEGAWKFLAYSIRHLSHHIDAHIKNTDAHIKNNGALHRSERRLTSESLTYSGGAATDPNYVTLRRAALDKRTRILCESIVGLLQSNKTFNLILRAIVHMDLYPAKAALYSTPLHVAVILGLFDAVKFIGLDKATLDRTDGLENTALTLAITHGHVDIAEFLIRQGCLVGLDSINGRRVFELAVHRKNLDIAKRMIDAAAAPEKPDRIWRVKSASKNKAIEFLNAALSGDLATVRILCKGDKLSQMKSTALLVATDRGYLDMVRNLLDSGADVNSRDLERRTALHRAVIRHDITMTTLLLDRRAKIDATDMSSDSPLTLAMRDAGNRPIFELLLERHADVNLADYLGQSMLYCAAACGNTAMVRRLLEAGAEPSIRTRFYWTPLVSNLMQSMWP
jgi:ankyrin repeat protein